MTDEELIRLRKKIRAGQLLSRQETWKALDTIAAIRTQLAEAQEERGAIITARDTMGNLWAQEKARADRAEAALAAQIRRMLDNAPR